ncbi:hypothetical protein ACFWG6_33795 [Streptomyces erythrochromogenes]|uniref:hypothetical protein n=1 Tax=Streptomyces erythrochromogenes TaxID=285574 RepID=UPI0036620CCB
MDHWGTGAVGVLGDGDVALGVARYVDGCSDRIPQVTEGVAEFAYAVAVGGRELTVVSGGRAGSAPLLVLVVLAHNSIVLRTGGHDQGVRDDL